MPAHHFCFGISSSHSGDASCYGRRTTGRTNFVFEVPLRRRNAPCSGGVGGGEGGVVGREGGRCRGESGREVVALFFLLAAQRANTFVSTVDSLDVFVVGRLILLGLLSSLTYPPSALGTCYHSGTEREMGKQLLSDFPLRRFPAHLVAEGRSSRIVYVGVVSVGQMGWCGGIMRNVHSWLRVMGIWVLNLGL